MNDGLAMAAVLSGYLLSRYAEYRVHKTNYNVMAVGGAEELMPRLMRRFYNWGLWVLVLALVERSASHWVVPPAMRGVILAAMMGAFCLRFWAIRSLGPQWSMRCLCNVGFAIISDGPYRWLRHPEYVSRIIEGAALCLFLGAPFSAVFYISMSVRYFLRIRRVERQQLEAMALPAPAYR